MKRMWSVLTMPYFVFTVVPSTMGRMSRCTPSRLTSGPWPPSRPAILSISSMKMMPACSTRSTAVRATLSMSISFVSSSCVRYSSASGIFIRRFFVFPWKRPGSMSFRLMSTSSTDDPAMISSDGNDFSRASTSTPREAARDFGLADAGRPDHQDVLRRDFLGELRRELLPPHPVAQGDRDGALGGRLADDVLVELGDDLPRRQRFGGGLRGFGKKDGHLEFFNNYLLVREDADLA